MWCMCRCVFNTSRTDTQRDDCLEKKNLFTAVEIVSGNAHSEHSGGENTLQK